MSTLPALMSADGEIVQALTAENLLNAAGIIDPRLADLSTLAEFALDADHLASLTKEAKGMVSDELVRRMDRLGRWTIHDGGMTMKSASPAAGTEKYDDERLADALATLVEDDLIDAEAALAALERVHPPAPEPYWKQKPAGIKSLLKLGGKVTETVLSAAIPTAPPHRSVKVTRSNARGVTR